MYSLNTTWSLQAAFVLTKVKVLAVRSVDNFTSKVIAAAVLFIKLAVVDAKAVLDDPIPVRLFHH